MSYATEELVSQGIVGISGIDTRALTRHLRERGAMRVGIFSGNAIADEGILLAKVRQAPEMKGADLAAFIPHQANMRIIDEFAKLLKLPDSVVIARDIETTGNTSSASIPLAAHRLLEEHPELSGGLALQIGFGAGLVFGAQVVVLP